MTGSTSSDEVARRRWIPAWLRRGGLVLVSALVVEYVVVPQISGARSAVALLSKVSPGFLAVGLALELASLVSYSSLTRCVLPATNRPRLWTILRIDISALGLSHVLPGGGATATALRYRLLTIAGTAGPDVLSAIAIEGTGVAGVLALVLGAGLVLAFPSASGNPYFVVAAAVAALLLAAGAAAALLLTRREQPILHLVRAAASVLPGPTPEVAQRAVKSLAVRLRTLGSDHRLLLTTVRWASGNWVFDAASLWVFLRAFGASEGLQGLLLGYGLAGILALLPLTPGGLGIVEGTLVSVLVGFGTPHPEAVIGVITWRLAEFWMPIPLAALAYLSLRTGTLRRDQLPARPLIPRPATHPEVHLDAATASTQPSAGSLAPTAPVRDPRYQQGGAGPATES
jgi:uncharacterized membrane protein YbhN (UPF0104 family)